MLIIRQNATHKVVIGPVVAVGDGFTPVVTLDVATADEAEVILHDNATVVDISLYTWAAIATADGYYHLTLQAGITSTVGHMTVVINDDNLCLPVRADFQIIEEAVYDAMYAASAAGPLQSTTAGRKLTVESDGVAHADVKEWLGVAPLALSSQQVQSIVPDTQKVDVETIKTQAVTCGAGVTVGAYVGGAAAHDSAQTGDTYAQLPTNFSSLSINAITGGVDVVSIKQTDATDAIQASCNSALVVLKLDHLLAVADSDDVVDNSVVAKMAASDGDWSGFSAATDSLEARADDKAGYSLSATGADLVTKTSTFALAMADAVWDEVLTESYAADGAAATPAQALYLIMQSLHEFSISGTTRTVKKLDGSTTAATFTLDDGDEPTSTTRAT